MRYKNTIVVEFDDLNNERRREVSEIITKGLVEGWVTYLSTSDDVDRSDFVDEDSGDE